MKFTRKPNPSKLLDDQIRRVCDAMNKVKVDSDEYEKLSREFERLQRLKNDSDEYHSLSKDAILTTMTSVATVAMILWHENAHVIMSKALGFVIKKRI